MMKLDQPERRRVRHSHDLSVKEKRVLEALRTGLNGPEIAAAMGVSINTVKFHRKNLYAKLGVCTLREALKASQAAGMSVVGSTPFSRTVG